jgi:gluconolactonase
MRWLWKDWPQPVVAGVSQNTFLAATLSPAETWQIVPGEYQSTGVMAANREGEILFQDIVGGKNWKIAVDGRLGDGFPIRNSAAGLAVGPDGRIYVSDVRSATIVAYGMDGKSSKIATGIRGPDLVVTHGGNTLQTSQAAMPAREESGLSNQMEINLYSILD